MLRGTPHLSYDSVRMVELGRYYPADAAILLRKGLTQTERRCTLAHELAHHRLGHTGTCDPATSSRQEAEADALAARWLITLEDLADAELWGRHPSEVAEELWVDVRMLRARVGA
jgi:Zn-dependent peptidase ImmA (M78 family)